MEGNVLFNDELREIDIERERNIETLREIYILRETDRDTERNRKEMFYLTTHSTHFIYGYITYGK